MAQEKKATAEPKKRSSSRKKTAAVAPSTPEMEQPKAIAEAKPPMSAHHGNGGPDAEEIRRRAYQLWEQRGGTHGSHEEDWFRAEQELRNKRSA